MSDQVSRSFNNTDIVKVHNFIEHCLTKYMTKKEAQTTLLREHKINPSVTEKAWELMEQENEEFFKEYYKKVEAKEQMEALNRLRKQKAALTGHPSASGDGPMLPSIVEKVLDEVKNRIFTEEGIQKVQNFIELCLSKCMTKKEAGYTLFREHKIEPLLTELVWRLLEQENEEFFKGYYVKLAQLESVNRLVEGQVVLRGPPGFSKNSSKGASTSSDKGPKMPSMQLQSHLPEGASMEIEGQHEDTQLPNSDGPLGLKNSILTALSMFGGKFTMDC